MFRKLLLTTAASIMVMYSKALPDEVYTYLSSVSAPSKELTKGDRENIGIILDGITEQLFTFNKALSPTTKGQPFGKNSIEELCEIFSEELGDAKNFIGKGSKINDAPEKKELRDKISADIMKVYYEYSILRTSEAVTLGGSLDEEQRKLLRTLKGKLNGLCAGLKELSRE